MTQTWEEMKIKEQQQERKEQTKSEFNRKRTRGKYRQILMVYMDFQKYCESHFYLWFLQ